VSASDSYSFRGSITRPSCPLCTLRSQSRPCTTQHSVPAGCQPLPGRFNSCRVPSEVFSRILLHMTSNSSRLCLAHFQQNRPKAEIRFARPGRRKWDLDEQREASVLWRSIGPRSNWPRYDSFGNFTEEFEGVAEEVSFMSSASFAPHENVPGPRRLRMEAADGSGKTSTRPEVYAIDIGITTSEMSACIEIRKAVARLAPQRADSSIRRARGIPKARPRQRPLTALQLGRTAALR
jgi:hypothetical protein